MFEMTGEAGQRETGKRRLCRRAGCGGAGGNGGGTVGARRLVPTRRRGKAWGVPGLTEPAGRDGAGGDERELEGWGGGMVGRAGAGRLVFRVMSSAKAVVSVGLLLTLGEAGLGNSDSVLSREREVRQSSLAISWKAPTRVPHDSKVLGGRICFPPAMAAPRMRSRS